MKEKRVRLKGQTSPCRLPAFAEAGTEELRFLCAVLVLGGEPTLAEIGAEAGLDMDEAAAALAFWRGAGALSLCCSEKKTEKKEDMIPPVSRPAQEIIPSTQPLRAEEKLPTYTAGQIADTVDRESLSSFLATCQQVHGKVLNETDIGILIGLYDHLQLEPEYICLLLAYYKKPLRYIEKVAFARYDEGIRTAAALTEYIDRRQKLDSHEGKLRRMFGIGERDLSAREEACFMRWITEYGYDEELIGLAYDITVNATGKAAVAYADKIITAWNTAGCKNAEDAKAYLDREKTARTSRPAKANRRQSEKDTAGKQEKEGMRSFDVDDFFSHALDRSYRDTDPNKKEDI